MATRETDRPLQRVIGERASGQFRYPQNLHHSGGHDQGRMDRPCGGTPACASLRSDRKLLVGRSQFFCHSGHHRAIPKVVTVVDRTAAWRADCTGIFRSVSSAPIQAAQLEKTRAYERSVRLWPRLGQSCRSSQRSRRASFRSLADRNKRYEVSVVRTFGTSRGLN
jgi:hypothetical protein